MPFQVAHWGGAISSSVSGTLSGLAAIPKIASFLGIILLGWMIASLTEKVLVACLRKASFDTLVPGSGLPELQAFTRIERDASALIGLLAKACVQLVVIAAALGALGMPLAGLLHQVRLWAPHVAGAAFMGLVIGGLVANAVAIWRSWHEPRGDQRLCRAAQRIRPNPAIDSAGRGVSPS